MPTFLLKVILLIHTLKKSNSFISSCLSNSISGANTWKNWGPCFKYVVKMYCRYTKNANAVKYILNLKTTQFVPSRRDHQNLFSSVQASIIMMANRKMDTPVKYN